MKRALKKGFTIVELAIVIAVIAILVAVIIPTVTTIVGNAKVSADTSMVKNLNTALAVEEAKDGKNATMTDVLDDVAEYGYDVTKLFPSSAGNDIVWDSKNDRFALVKTEGNEVVYSDASYVTNAPAKIDCWKIAETYSAEEDYSVFLKEGYAGESALTVSTGIDVGNNEGIAVTYKSDSNASATVRTNGGALTVEAPNGTVNHYGGADSATINAVANESYHEYGKIVGNISVAAGHVQIEGTGEAAAVIVTADGVTVDAANDVPVAVLAGVTAGTINGATPVENVDTAVLSKFAGGFGTESSPYLIGNIDQLKNVDKLSTAEGVYFELISDLNFETDDLQTYKWSGYDWYSYCCVKNFVGFFNGNNHTITLPKALNVNNSSNNGCIFYSTNNAYITDLVCENARLINNMLNGSLINITVIGVLSFENNEGVLAGYASGELYFTNCKNLANVNSSSWSAVFVGAHNASTKSTFHFENCYNAGTYVGKYSALFIGNAYGSGAIDLFVDNCGNEIGGTVRATDTSNSYTMNHYISYSLKTNIHSLILNGKNASFTTSLGNGFYQGPNDTLTIVKGADSSLTITKSNNINVAYYVLQLGVYTRSISDGGTQIFSVQERIDAFESESYTATMKYLNFTDNDQLVKQDTFDGWDIVSNGAESFYLFKKAGYSLGTNVKPQIVTVLAYDADGNLISSATLAN